MLAHRLQAKLSGDQDCDINIEWRYLRNIIYKMSESTAETSHLNISLSYLKILQPKLSQIHIF